MDDLEFIKAFGKILQDYMDSEDDNNFEVNPPQMKKFKKALCFFAKMADENPHMEISASLTPRLLAGHITVSAVLFDFWGEFLSEFQKIVQDLSVITLDVELPDKVELSCNIPDVFIAKG